MGRKGPEPAKMILKKNQAGKLTVANFKTYYKTKAIKTVWYWHQDNNGTEVNGTKQYRSRLTHIQTTDFQSNSKGNSVQKE